MELGLVTDDLQFPFLLSTFAVSAILCYVVFFFAGKAAGRRRAPPLPPGPRGWPVLGNLPQLGGKTHQTLHEMTKVYGPLLRLRFGSSNVVVAGSAAVAEQFLRIHDANFSCRPPNSGGEHMAYNYQDVVFAPYGPRWRAMRKVCAVNLFSARALDDLRGVREREAALMVRSLSLLDADQAVVPLGKAVNVCTTNAVSRAAVGLRVFADDGNEGGARHFKEIVLEVMQVGGVLNVGDFVPALRWLDPQGVVAKMKKLHRRFDDMMNSIISERRSGLRSTAAEDSKDLLGLLLAMVEKEQPLTGGDEDRINDTDVKALILVRSCALSFCNIMISSYYLLYTFSTTCSELVRGRDRHYVDHSGVVVGRTDPSPGHPQAGARGAGRSSGPRQARLRD
jgi:flavonoid 3'-monooxygenase